MEIEDLLVRFLRKQGITCATMPRVSVPTPSDLDAGPSLTLSTAKLLASGSGNPDWVVRDWFFTLKAGGFLSAGRTHGFEMSSGFYDVKDRRVRRCKALTKEDRPWTKALQAGYEEGWRQALNDLVDYLRKS